MKNLTISRISGDPDPSSNEYGIPDRLLDVARSLATCPCPVNYATMKDEIARYEGKAWHRVTSRRIQRLEKEIAQLDLAKHRIELENQRLQAIVDRLREARA